jgi:hypothetical protein
LSVLKKNDGDENYDEDSSERKRKRINFENDIEEDI